MKNKNLLTWLTIFLLATTSCNDQPKPNFIFILVDDLGWTDLGCYNSSFYETPNIDRLAAAGTLFTNAYAASPVCSPTRASILTGKYPSRVGITDWIPGHDPKDRKLLGPKDLHELPLSEITVAEAFKKQGYQTFFAGKWHLGDEGFFPEDQGFDVNFGGHHKGSPPGGYYSPYKNPKLSDGPEGEYLTDRLTDESIRFLENNQTNPFFLFLSFYTVHTPIQANKKHIGKFEEKASLVRIAGPERSPEHDGMTRENQVNPAYASMVHALDENIGRLLDKVKAANLDKNTYIILTSDNGGLSTLNKRRTAPTSVRPLRAGKGWCYEGGIRVPLIIKVPTDVSVRKEPPNTSDIPVISTDFYPTLLDMAGVPAMPDQHRDGISLLPILQGGEAIARKALFWHFPHYHGSTWTPGSAIRVGQWKLIEFYDYEKTELYDLTGDLEEQNDLSKQYPQKTRELQALLNGYLEETGAQKPMINPDRP